jgi:class 3 adenylate cyclase
MSNFVERLLGFGSYEGEATVDSGRRRIVIGALWVSLPFIVGSSLSGFAKGVPLVAILVGIQAVRHLGGLMFLKLRPLWIVAILSVVFAYDVVGELLVSYLYGGPVASGGTTIWSLIAVLAALLVFSVRSAAVWFAVYASSIAIAATMPGWVEPTYVLEGVDAELALSLIGATFLAFLVMVYFVLQRDRFQRVSDDLLHNILPEPIAERLKVDPSLIADDASEVSVLFADIVGFTPLTANMPANELIGLLNDVFQTLDDLVHEFGLEKIKTVGDEYMIAAGVPTPDQDHAVRIADLALRIRDTMRESEFGGHTLQMRIGISSGSVVAGVIGTSKFAYDLWGATVNTASRMESSGLPDKIQITATTEKLLRDLFVLEPRRSVPVKGLGEMDTFILVARRDIEMLID